MDSPKNGSEQFGDKVAAIIATATNLDGLDITNCQLICERRRAEKARLEEALEGDNFADVKTAYAATKANEGEAQQAKIYLLARLRRIARKQILTGIVDFHDHKISVNEFADQLTELFDAVIESDLSGE